MTLISLAEESRTVCEEGSNNYKILITLGQTDESPLTRGAIVHLARDVIDVRVLANEAVETESRCIHGAAMCKECSRL